MAPPGRTWRAAGPKTPSQGPPCPRRRDAQQNVLMSRGRGRGRGREVREEAAHPPAKRASLARSSGASARGGELELRVARAGHAGGQAIEAAELGGAELDVAGR